MRCLRTFCAVSISVCLFIYEFCNSYMHWTAILISWNLKIMREPQVIRPKLTKVRSNFTFETKFDELIWFKRMIFIQFLFVIYNLRLFTLAFFWLTNEKWLYTMIFSPFLNKRNKTQAKEQKYLFFCFCILFA